MNVRLKKYFLRKGRAVAARVVVIGTGLIVSACGGRDAAGPSLFEQRDSARTGIGFVNRLPENDDKLNILEYLYYYNGAGVGAGDINNDGLTDLFFVSNQGKNKLYLNKGGLQFEDISAKAGIEGFADWKTGVTMADVNADGLLDIYVCAVANYKGLEGANELYINNGDGTFTERAADYGLDFTGFATQAAFFDYDKDGDLDCYLLTHAVHTARSYEYVSTRSLKNNEAGDYLFENTSPPRPQGGAKTPPSGAGVLFVDVSRKAGIYQAAMGYGLGLVVADLNNDGWDDIYVANDFHEDDYYYVNNRNGTFTESVKTAFTHLSRYSMGCDAADLNNDGLLDVMTLDMHPEDEAVEKSSMGEDALDVYLMKLAFGYHHQLSRNCLQLNLGADKFTDIGSMAGVAATDWSWSPLLADFDNDGIKDIFVANGIVKRPNDLDYLKYLYTDSVKYAMMNGQTRYDRAAIAQMPAGKVHNYLFRGTPSLEFEDKSEAWGLGRAGISNGAAYADLDNDGDLEIVTNNINEPAGMYENTASRPRDGKAPDTTANGFLRIRLAGAKPNGFGVGATVTLWRGGRRQVQQLMPTRGFLSSVEPVLTFGLGAARVLDSLEVVWPDRRAEVRIRVPANQTLVLRQADARLDADRRLPRPAAPLLEDATAALKLPYRHAENNHYDFNREPLMPFKVSTEGPALAVGDVNADGREDFYAGGAKWQPGELYLQRPDGTFAASVQPVFRTDSTYEDVDAVFFDADNDRDLDLYVVSGGNEFYGEMPEQFDRLYLNDGRGNFTRGLQNLPPMFANKSCVRPVDFDRDGDLDLFVGGRVTGYAYGRIPDSFLLVNDGRGRFADRTDALAPGLKKAGMVADAVWADADNDRDMDLLVAGDWMAPALFENRNGKFAAVPLAFTLGDGTPNAKRQTLNGFWQAVAAADFDRDGDVDFVLGNLGTNTKFRKSGAASVLRMYVKDIDRNQTLEQVLAYNRGDRWYPVSGKEELGKQIPSVINRRFQDYKSFAGKPLEQIFQGTELDSAEVREVDTFESVYLENTGKGGFRVHPLPLLAQASKIFALHVADFTADGLPDVLLGGNLYGASPYQGRYDGSRGLLLAGTGKGGFRAVPPAESGILLEGEVRHIRPMRTVRGPLYLAARNNLPLQVLKPAAPAPVEALHATSPRQVSANTPPLARSRRQ